NLFKLLKVPVSRQRLKWLNLTRRSNLQRSQKPKAKGLAVLSEVALTKVEQLKLATKRSKKDFHISHTSGSGDGVDTQLKVLDEQHLKTTGVDERTGTILGVPDVPIYESKNKKESWGDSGEEDEDDESDSVDKSDGDDNDDGSSGDYDDDKEDVNERVHSPSDYELTDDEKIHDEEYIDEEYEDEITKSCASKKQYASQQLRFEQEEEDAHVTLTPVLDTQKTGGPTQSSSVSFNFTSKLLNLDNPSPAGNEIASLMDTTAHHATVIPEIISSFTITIPAPPPFFNPLSQQATPTPTPTTSETKTSLPALLDFDFVFKFDEKVTNLEKRSVRDKANVATLVIEKNVIESLEAAILTRSSSQPQSSYERSREDKDKDQDPSTGLDRGTKRRKSSKDDKSSRDSRSKERSLQAPLKTPPNLNISLPVSLYMQRSQVILLKTHACNKIKSLSRETMINNPLTRRLRLQDIEDMLLLLVQQDLTNLTIDEHYDLNVTLRMYTRCIVIQRRVEDLQLGVESFQKMLNLTKLDTYRSNLRNKTAYTSYSDPHGIIYVDRYRRKRLMHADELRKFSDGTLNDVRSALHDIAAGIRMNYLPMRKWSNLDKKKARVMVQDIDKQLYQRRLMRNLKKFVGEREYRNDFRLLERTI
nr:hypothetical protein [Tanacetum cinerariifolium]